MCDCPKIASNADFGLLGWHEELQRAPEQLKPQAWCKPQQALVSRLRTGFNQ